MSGRQTLRTRCAEGGCTESAFYDGMTIADQQKLAGRPWQCVRHSRPDEVIGASNPRRSIIVTAEKSRRFPELTKLFWREEAADDAGSGFIHGPGFKAFADDFPEGSQLRITVDLLGAPSPGDPS